MRPLPALSNTIISTLQASPLCIDVQIIEVRAFTETQFRIKFRAELVDNGVLQVYLYVNREHIDYSYQFLRSEKPVLRWDNKEHFPNISSYPHHFHANAYEVQESTLTGEPENDLPFVLDYLATQKFKP